MPKLPAIIGSIAKRKTYARGFTLIELLVVIGILGILAAALIATIDPFEQLKKANDTTAKNTATEFVDALARYYSNHNAYPWDATGSNCNGATSPSGVSLVAANGTVWDCVTALITEGEVKSNFSNATTALKAVSITVPASATTPVACYKPQSKSGQKDPNTKYTALGVADTTCKSQNGTKDCYYCAQ